MEQQLSLLIQLQEMDLKMRASERETEAVSRDAGVLRTAARAEQGGTGTGPEKPSRRRRRTSGTGTRTWRPAFRRWKSSRPATSEIKTNKEYQALLKEIETAEKENKAIEDEILVLMEKIDAAASQIDDGRRNGLARKRLRSRPSRRSRRRPLPESRRN